MDSAYKLNWWLYDKLLTVAAYVLIFIAIFLNHDLFTSILFVAIVVITLFCSAVFRACSYKYQPYKYKESTSFMECSSDTVFVWRIIRNNFNCSVI